MQSRLESLLEALATVAVGFLVALVSQMLIFPLYGIHVPVSTNIQITVWFTFISILRSYLLRRFYNSKKVQRKS